MKKIKKQLEKIRSLVVNLIYGPYRFIFTFSIMGSSLRYSIIKMQNKCTLSHLILDLI